MNRRHASMHSCIQSHTRKIAMSKTADNNRRIGKPPSRIGKTGVTCYLEKEAIIQLKQIGLEEERTLQSLMIEATNLLFRKRKKDEIAK